MNWTFFFKGYINVRTSKSTKRSKFTRQCSFYGSKVNSNGIILNVTCHKRRVKNQIKRREKGSSVSEKRRIAEQCRALSSLSYFLTNILYLTFQYILCHVNFINDEQ